MELVVACLAFEAGELPSGALDNCVADRAFLHSLRTLQMKLKWDEAEGQR